MTREIHIERNMVPEWLREGYSGHKFKVVITDQICPHDMQWSGGTRSTYTAVNLDTRESRPIVDSRPFPENQYTPPDIPMRPGWAIVSHSIFCGKDMGITFYLHADNGALMLPDNGPELTHAEMIVLAATEALKASYNGRKPRIDAAREHGVSLPEFQAAQATLIEKGMLRKNGSITPKGRNSVDPSIRIY